MVGLAARASWTAEDWRLVDTRLARSGSRAPSDEKGGLDSNKEMLSGDSSSGLMSSGGSSNSKSSSSSGKAGGEVACWPRFADAFFGSGGTADEMAWASRCFFADFRR